MPRGTLCPWTTRLCGGPRSSPPSTTRPPRAARPDGLDPDGARRRAVPRGRPSATRSTSSARARSSSAGPARRPREPLAILGPGEMFGELSLFDPGPRTMTATAVAETQLMELGNDSLTGLLSGRPEVAKACWRAGPAAAAHQRAPRRPRLHRRARPGGQGAARPRRPLRPPRRGWRHGQPRPHAGGAGAAGRRSRETVNKALADFASRGWLKPRPVPCCCSTSTDSPAGPADRAELVAAVASGNFFFFKKKN